MLSKSTGLIVIIMLGESADSGQDYRQKKTRHGGAGLIKSARGKADRTQFIQATGYGLPQPVTCYLVDIVNRVIDVEFARRCYKFRALDNGLEFTGLVINDHDG